MAKYKGWSFQRWCRLDPDDERKINYTLRGVWDGKEQEANFTSDDTVDIPMLMRIREAKIECVELLANNEWAVSLVY